MLKKVGIISCSFLFFITFLLLSFWTNLSEEKLKEFIEYQINSSLNKTAQIKIESVKKGMWYITFYKLVLADSKSLKLLEVDKGEVDFSLIPLIFSQSINFEFNLYNGHVLGDINLVGEKEIYAKGKGVELNRNHFLRTTNLIANNPVASFELNSSWKNIQKKFFPCECKFELKSLSLNGKNNLIPFQILPDLVRFQQVNLDLKSVNRNKFRTDLDFSGDLTGEIKGDFIVNQRNILNSRMNQNISFQVKEEFKKEMGILANFIQAYEVRPFQYQLKVTGKVSFPKARKI